MAFDNSRFLFHLMKTVPSEISEINEMYRCSPTTLSQLQDKVLRSMVGKCDEDNLQLQVVPRGDCLSKEETAVSCLKSCALKCHENCSKDFSREVSSSIFDRRDNIAIEATLQNLQSDINSWKTPLVSITTCSSPEPLRTPTFQFSPLKSPARASEAPVSPLAAMILSPFGRKISEDLSVYLPDNFTPVATLERLENSITSTVFEFPTVVVNREDHHKTVSTFKKNEGEGIKRGCSCSGTDFEGQERVDAENADVFVDLDAINCLEELQTIVNCEIECDAPERGKKKRKREELAENVHHFRNKLERRRRNEMNFKFDKLRQCIPAIEKREKVAKIVVLRSAVEYIRELQGQDRLLAKQKDFEKMKNGQLLKQLVKINS